MIPSLKDAETSLEERESLHDQLTAIASAVPGMIARLRMNPDGSTIMPYASPALWDLCGLRQEDVLEDARPILAIIHKDDIGHVRHRIAESVQNLIHFRDEWRVHHPLRGEIWIEGHAVPQREADGSTVWHGFFQDVTERKNAEVEHHALLEIMQGLAITKDLHEFLALVHSSIARVIYADNFFVALHNEDSGLFELAYSVDEYDEPSPPDELEKSVSAFVFRSGEPLLLSQERFDELVAQGEVELVGTNSPSWLGVPLKTSSKTIGIMAVQHYEDPNCYSERDKEFFTSIAGQVALAVQRKRGEEALARLLEQVQRSNTELELRVLERTSDLSRVNLELERAARAKDEFLASMSHELRTPLNAILTLTESLEEGIYGTLSDRQLAPLHTIAESGYHLLDLINDILDLSKIEAGKMELQLAPVEVEPLAQSSLRLVRQQAQNKRLQIKVSIDPDVTYLRGDVRRLKQMLVNLLSNAVKFTPQGGQIGLEVRGDAVRGVVYFTVWDTGIGISPDQAKGLFRPFIQVDSGLTRQYGGTGLGLSLVYRLAEMHNGSVTLSSSLGQGSRFTISLPWSGPGQARGTGPLIPGNAPNVRRALVVEDSPTASDQLTRYLSELGARVAAYPAGKSALSKTLEIQPEVILLDIQLPGLSGWEVLEQLKADERTKAIPVIVVTVVDEPERGLALGAADYILKPVTRQRLYEALWKALDPAFQLGEEQGEKPNSSGGPVILIAEDNLANKVTFSDYLSFRGYRVIGASNGVEAIESARQNHPDLILMDIQMPGMDGMEATRRLRLNPEFRNTPIIAITALAMPGDNERCLAAGANAYLTKPIALKQLSAAIESHLNGRST